MAQLSEGFKANCMKIFLGIEYIVLSVVANFAIIKWGSGWFIPTAYFLFNLLLVWLCLRIHKYYGGNLWEPVVYFVVSMVTLVYTCEIYRMEYVPFLVSTIGAVCLGYFVMMRKNTDPDPPK